MIIDFLKNIKILIFICIIYLINSCSYYYDNVPLKTVLLNDLDQTKRIESLPFKHSYVYKKIPRGFFKKIYIKKINLTKEAIENWKDSLGIIINSKDQYVEESNLVAEYFHGKLIENIKKNSPDFEIVSSPALDAVQVEISIVELVYSKPSLEVGSLLTPIPGSGFVISSYNTARIAFVMIIKDSNTGEIIASIADRKFPPMKIIDINKLTVTASIREICDHWSSMITKTFLIGHLTAVESEGDFSLLPW